MLLDPYQVPNKIETSEQAITFDPYISASITILKTMPYSDPFSEAIRNANLIRKPGLPDPTYSSIRTSDSKKLWA